jgi:hypothetical protein
MRARVGITLVVLAALDGSARADSKACDDAFAEAPASVRAGHLLAGRQALLRCSADGCPGAMRPLCLDDLRSLELRIPSVVLIAKNADGHDLSDVRVSEGTHVLAAELDGRAIDLDPGRHMFHFERSGSDPVVVDVLLAEGEKTRAIVATFAAPPSASGAPATPEGTPVASRALVGRESSATKRPVPWTVYAAAGVALAASAGWAYFGIEGLSDRSALASCKGHCSSGPVQSASTDLDVADVFMAVSLVGWVGAATLFLTRPSVVPVVAGTRDHAAFGVAGSF